MGFMYASTDDNGLLNRVVDFFDELTWDQKVELGVKDFLDEPLPANFDPATQKTGEVIIVETTDLIVRKVEILQKNEEDLFQDKMVGRQVALPMPEVSVIVLTRILDRLIRSAELQMEPADPKTHLNILEHDKALLREILATADQTSYLDPHHPDLPPGGDAPDSTRTPPAADPPVDPAPV